MYYFLPTNSKGQGSITIIICLLMLNSLQNFSFFFLYTAYYTVQNDPVKRDSDEQNILSSYFMKERTRLKNNRGLCRIRHGKSRIPSVHL